MSAALQMVPAVGGLVQGLGQRAALKSEAKALEYQAKAEQLRGKQISAVRRQELNETLATIDSIRVSRGLSVDSPGSVNIRRQNRSVSQTNENAEVLSSKFREMDIKTQAAAKRRAAPFALLAGITNAAGSLAGTSFFNKGG